MIVWALRAIPKFKMLMRSSKKYAAHGARFAQARCVFGACDGDLHCAPCEQAPPRHVTSARIVNISMCNACAGWQWLHSEFLHSRSLLSMYSGLSINGRGHYLTTRGNTVTRKIENVDFE